LITGVQGGTDNLKAIESLFKGVIIENFPNLEKDTNIQLQET
jgi:hypothetical protein